MSNRTSDEPLLILIIAAPLSAFAEARKPNVPFVLTDEQRRVAISAV